MARSQDPHDNQEEEPELNPARWGLSLASSRDFEMAIDKSDPSLMLTTTFGARESEVSRS